MNNYNCRSLPSQQPPHKIQKNNKSLAISVDNLTYGYGEEINILEHLNLHLEEGSRCLLVGANGTGKNEINKFKKKEKQY